MTFAKADAGKPPWQLLPLDAVELIVRVVGYGATKYGPNNWRTSSGDDVDRWIGAMLRHLKACQCGERNDPESGLPHLAHLACNAVFLLWHRECRRAEADR